jgi:hypothetical protein
MKTSMLIAKNCNQKYTYTYKGFNIVMFIITLFSYSTILHAQGSLLLTPKRIVFEGKKTSESINLANSGKDTARYVISLVNLKMKEDGSFEEVSINEASSFSAEPYIRYFPRTVTLAPNEGQVIKMQLNNSSKLTTGEYRSHLYVRAYPKKALLGESKPEENQAIGVKLTPIFGISLPVIIRVGKSNAIVNITELKVSGLHENKPSLTMKINRTGNMSVYGDIIVRHISPNGLSTLVGNINGLAVYSPNSLRNLVLPLNENLMASRKNGKLVVQFYSNHEGKDKKIAESELALQ